MLLDTQRLYDRLCRIHSIRFFKHVNMRISLSPLAYCDLAVPDSVPLDDPIAVHLFELAHHPGVIASHKLDEAAQCELFRVAINGLVQARMHVFPNMRSLTLEVSLHAKKWNPNAPNNPLDRCGITFYVRINLGRRNDLIATHDNATDPFLASASLIQDPAMLQRANYEAHDHSLQPTVIGSAWIAPFLDPRRHMLSPLVQLFDVRNVEVERRWTVIYRQQATEDGSIATREQPLRQLWRFLTVGEMLERAGPKFDEFLDPALAHLKASDDDVVDIIENTWDIPAGRGYLLIP